MLAARAGLRVTFIVLLLPRRIGITAKSSVYRHVRKAAFCGACAGRRSSGWLRDSNIGTRAWLGSVVCADHLLHCIGLYWGRFGGPLRRRVVYVVQVMYFIIDADARG